LRSEKIEPVYQGCDRISQGTNFGYQIDWFKETLLKAKSEGKVVAWISGIPFINHPGGPNYECNEDDDWGGYPEERMEIANFIRDNEISIFILAGDAHMLSIDNGTNSDYSHQGGAPIPVFHAGPLYQTPSYKGGPYSHGISLMNEQYGVMEVVDEGLDSINIKWTGKNKLNQVALNEQGEPIQYEFSFYLGKITTLDENKLTKFDVVVFPNPNNDQLHLEFDGNLPQKAKIRIFALTGGLVLEESLIIENKVSIISHNLTPGTYYFELVIKKEIFQKKLVIAR
jgi:hypothetical protein